MRAEVVGVVVNVYGPGSAPVIQHGREGAALVVVVELELADGSSVELPSPITGHQAVELLVNPTGQGVRLAKRFVVGEARP